MPSSSTELDKQQTAPRSRHEVLEMRPDVEQPQLSATLSMSAFESNAWKLALDRTRGPNSRIRAGGLDAGLFVTHANPANAEASSATIDEARESSFQNVLARCEL